MISRAQFKTHKVVHYAPIFTFWYLRKCFYHYTECTNTPASGGFFAPWHPAEALPPAPVGGTAPQTSFAPWHPAGALPPAPIGGTAPHTSFAPWLPAGALPPAPIGGTDPRLFSLHDSQRGLCALHPSGEQPPDLLPQHDLLDPPLPLTRMTRDADRHSDD